MRITLVGYGKMGEPIERAISRNNHELIHVIDRSSPRANARVLTVNALKEVDVCLDFTHSTSTLDHLRIAADAGRHIVLGTTGWYVDEKEVRQIIETGNIGMIHGNFAIGVHLFCSIVQQAAQLLHPHSAYDVAGVEWHHKHKGDSPSGTARELANRLLRAFPRKQTVVYDRLNRPLQAHEMQFSSVRGGHIPGTHEIVFDSPHDTITLCHAARSREAFADGAIQAAEWIVDKPGYFTVEDMLLAFPQEEAPATIREERPVGTLSVDLTR